MDYFFWRGVVVVCIESKIAKQWMGLGCTKSEWIFGCKRSYLLFVFFCLVVWNEIWEIIMEIRFGK